MSLPPGTSHLLRRGFLGPQEKVLFETHASRWFFFFWPLGWLAIFLIADYAAISSAYGGLPAVPWLTGWMATTIPDARSGAGTALLLLGTAVGVAVLLLLWNARDRIVSAPLRDPHAAAASPESVYRAERRVQSGPLVRILRTIGAVFALLGIALGAVGLLGRTPVLQPVSRWLAGISVPGMTGLPIVSVPILGAVLLLTAIAVLDLLYRWYEWVDDSYVVTTERLIKQHGVVTHDFKEIPIGQVHTVEVHQKKVWARILHYGTLEMNSLADLPNPGGVSRSGAWMAPNPKVLDPYLNPRDPLVDAVGVEKWFCVPEPLRIQQTIERANEDLEHGPATAR